MGVLQSGEVELREQELKNVLASIDAVKEQVKGELARAFRAMTELMCRNRGACSGAAGAARGHPHKARRGAGGAAREHQGDHEGAEERREVFEQASNAHIAEGGAHERHTGPWCSARRGIHEIRCCPPRKGASSCVASDNDADVRS